MALQSPSIITNGLVFAYDMNNPKSYQGEPTVNLFYNHSTNLAASQNWTNSGAWSANDNATDVPLPVFSSQIDSSNMRILSGVITTASTQGCQFGSTTVTVSANTTYTMSCYYMQNRAMANNAAPYMRGIVLNNYKAGFAYNGSTNPATWPVGKWIRISCTATIEPTETGIYLSQYFGEIVGDKIWMCGFQVEAKSYATPLVVGTRSTSQVMLNQVYSNVYRTNSNSQAFAVPSNLVYSSTGFTFDGTSYLNANDLSYVVDMINSYTVELVFKSTAVENYRNIFDAAYGSVNYGPRLEQNSSGYLCWITANTSGSYTSFPVRNSGLEANVYHHVAITAAGNQIKTYYNGKLVTNATNQYVQDNDKFYNVTFGRGFSSNQNERWFKGEIPVGRIYNRALNANEIMNNFSAIRGKYAI